MAKVQKTIGLSRDMIIHPGETLAEVLENREMSQRELAIRTGMTEKHISTVVRGLKGISPAFARKLEYALGIEASFWLNLQANYDNELLEFEEINNISNEEIEVLHNLKEVIACWSNLGWMQKDTDKSVQVLELRRILRISNLLDATKMTYSAAYRAQTKSSNIDLYVLFAWQRMCELFAAQVSVKDKVDLEKLENSIPKIKQIMFSKEEVIPKELTEILGECGISFCIVPHFRGAPVQGFIKDTEDHNLTLCMTLRQKSADIFWFTLFHEIAHIMNGDAKNTFVDFDSVSSDMETKADRMAADYLIEPKAYHDFVASKRYQNYSAVIEFAKEQDVQDYIIQGRLMKEELIPWKARHVYDWCVME